MQHQRGSYLMLFLILVVGGGPREGARIERPNVLTCLPTAPKAQAHGWPLPRVGFGHKDARSVLEPPNGGLSYCGARRRKFFFPVKLHIRALFTVGGTR